VSLTVDQNRLSVSLVLLFSPQTLLYNLALLVRSAHSMLRAVPFAVRYVHEAETYPSSNDSCTDET
jgi:hypothetical protein